MCMYRCSLLIETKVWTVEEKTYFNTSDWDAIDWPCLPAFNSGMDTDMVSMLPHRKLDSIIKRDANNVFNQQWTSYQPRESFTFSFFYVLPLGLKHLWLAGLLNWQDYYNDIVLNNFSVAKPKLCEALSFVCGAAVVTTISQHALCKRQEDILDWLGANTLFSESTVYCSSDITWLSEEIKRPGENTNLLTPCSFLQSINPVLNMLYRKKRLSGWDGFELFQPHRQKRTTMLEDSAKPWITLHLFLFLANTPWFTPCINYIYDSSLVCYWVG